MRRDHYDSDCGRVFNAYDEPQAGPTECDHCGGCEFRLLGTLAALNWWRCRDCGAEGSTKA